MTRHRLLGALLAATLSLAACGGDDGAGPTGPIGGGTTVPGGPTSPVPDGVPEALWPAIGPVDVVGEPLPELPDGATPETDPALGAAAPVLVGLDFAAEPVRIDAATDGPTLVVFVAHWCPHCNAEVPEILELEEQGRLPDGLDIVAVSTGPAADRPNFPPGEWLDGLGWEWPVMADSFVPTLDGFVAAGAYGVSGFPFVTLLDGEGKVAARWSGEVGGEEFLARIERYLPTAAG